MLIKVHYGNNSILLVNGNCQKIHLLNYIRTHCCLSSKITIDLCSIINGEPFHLSSDKSSRLPFHYHCVLTRIDGLNILFVNRTKESLLVHSFLEDGTYIPLLNDPTIITNEFLMKLKRATTTKGNFSENNSKSIKQTNQLVVEKPKRRRRSLKSIAIVATIVTKFRK